MSRHLFIIIWHSGIYQWDKTSIAMESLIFKKLLEYCIQRLREISLVRCEIFLATTLIWIIEKTCNVANLYLYIKSYSIVSQSSGIIRCARVFYKPSLVTKGFWLLNNFIEISLVSDEKILQFWKIFDDLVSYSD